jgi:lysophospholipase L1-like esterase
MRVIPLLLLFISSAAMAQNLPFYEAIQEFKTLDSLHHPPKNAILFTGSSSFTMWDDVQKYFPNQTIINRAFGGSSLTDLIRYEQEVIFSYTPKQVVVYCGENDFAAADSITAAMVFDRFVTLFTDIRKRLPAASIVYVSIKPSPSRRHLQSKIKVANASIKTFLANQQNTAFVNIYSLMLHLDGSMMGELFLPDSLHMNAGGYAIWQKAIAPYLLK